jgi:type IV pilus assembly protein PilQ
VNEKRYREAEALLASLRTQPYYQEEVAKLTLAIEQGVTAQGLRAAQAVSAQQAVREVEDRLLLPATYGKTLVISAETGNRELPMGAMEKLVNRPVSMKLQDAGVKELIAALSEIEGLNVIADQALKEERRISVSVSDVMLRELLAYMSANMGLDFHVGENLIWVTAARKKPATGAELETRYFKLQRGFIPVLDSVATDAKTPLPSAPEDSDLEDALKLFFADSGEGTVYRIFRNRNVLLVRSTRENLRVVEELLKMLDQEPLQVLIEARFVTIRQGELFKLGLTLNRLVVPPKSSQMPSDAQGNAQDNIIGFQELSPIVSSKVINYNKTTGAVDSVVQTFKDQTQMSEALSRKRFEAFGTLPGSLTLSGILGNTTYQAVLDALQQSSSSKTLSAPRVTVANNRRARIHRGSKRYYFEEYDLQSVDLGDLGKGTKLVPTGKPKELELGYVLDVKVNAGNDGKTVMLALRPEITDFAGWDDFESTRLPVVDKNELATTVVVGSGETVVLGGMINKTETEQVQKVPYLGDIPVLGYLFRFKETNEEPQHLLIFVTATLIGSGGEYIEVNPPALAPLPPPTPALPAKP